jgi:hypothetical protein
VNGYAAGGVESISPVPFRALVGGTTAGGAELIGPMPLRALVGGTMAGGVELISPVGIRSVRIRALGGGTATGFLGISGLSVTLGSPLRNNQHIIATTIRTSGFVAATGSPDKTRTDQDRGLVTCSKNAWTRAPVSSSGFNLPSAGAPTMTEAGNPDIQPTGIDGTCISFPKSEQ